MHFSIRYLTEYRYKKAVHDNLNAMRVKPATTPTQRVDDFGVRVDPEARIHQHLDYFGTTVIEFGVSRPHEHLSIDVRARVATTEPPEPPDASWGALDADAYRSVAGEYLMPFGTEPSNGALDELSELTRARTPLGTLRLLAELIPDRFEYKKGVTYVDATVDDLIEAGAGVCQDFVHLSLVLLRRHGIAARYVSGYLFASGSKDADDSIEVDTHAWVEALVPGLDGAGPAWVGIDPTNRGLSSERHVKIGHGRHYSDVPPIKGVYRGPGGAETSHRVRMTKVAPG